MFFQTNVVHGSSHLRFVCKHRIGEESLSACHQLTSIKRIVTVIHDCMQLPNKEPTRRGMVLTKQGIRTFIFLKGRKIQKSGEEGSEG